MAEETVDQDIQELRDEFLNREFDEVTFEIDGTRFAEYAKVCGETAPRFTDPNDADFQAPPTFVSTLVGGRSMPPDFPNLGGMGMDAGKSVEWKAPCATRRRSPAAATCTTSTPRPAAPGAWFSSSPAWSCTTATPTSPTPIPEP